MRSTVLYAYRSVLLVTVILSAMAFAASSTIVGVFTDAAKAERCAALAGEDARVEEWPMDPDHPDPGALLYYCRMQRDGHSRVSRRRRKSSKAAWPAGSSSTSTR